MFSLKPAALLIASAGVLAVAGAPGPAAAQATGKDWMLALSVLRDDDANEHVLASFHLGLSDATWLSFMGGKSRAPSIEQDVSASVAIVGIEHDFGPIGLGFEVEHWGDRNNLESDDWQAEIFIDRDRFRVGITHDHRDIDIYFSPFGAPFGTDLRRIGVDADGLRLDGRVRLDDDWQIYGSVADYDYPRGLRLVPRADRLNLLSSSSVTLAYGFVDQFATLGVERALRRKLINFDVSKDRSTIDRQKLTSVAASVLWAVSPRVDLEMRIGSSRANGQSSSLFGGLTLLIYGGG